MKKILFILCMIFMCTASHAQTETMNWYVEGALYDTTTCESGGDIDLPAITPTKRGYTFQGWWTYTQLEYLESTGTQYIDTGFVPRIETKFEIRVQCLTNALQDFAGLSSVETGGAQTFFSPLTVAQNSCVYYFNSYHITSGLCRVNDIITASIYVMPSQAEIVQNNETINITNAYTQNGVFIPSNTLYLFAGHYNDSGKGVYAGEFATARIFYAKIWQGDTLVRDFVPVLDYNGVPCMFDKVSETFFYNQGTGDFIAGPIVAEE